ncbi:helix-turn-helix domain-containing protein [Sabulilitoribacter multivorans]|uniref:Helix-turn-helix domain-containing protein n=1 Tax=Flaviramulus multivorans TaxID=1304750 RepID=A0ABS9IJ55_9FLAO|nr:helix-turn-helix domain-containing protein [Flaviramulus multivorans]MCF7560530.1 helix-turn-helix domain-containing protein [Flaviramulus multivorans]
MEEIYFQKDASPKISGIIKSFWQIDNKENTSIVREKIIPDGYPELIFHFGDCYRTNINGVWQTQGRNLIAGQIKNHFFLENTGKSKIFGIKFQPWGLNELFKIEMSGLTDKVIEVPDKVLETIMPVKEISVGSLSFDEKVIKIEHWFIEYLLGLDLINFEGQKAVELIIEKKGKTELKTIQREVGISERSLERYFRTKIGLSPKYYSRIIRFSHIFKLAQLDEIDWSDIVFLTGYYDQSHFIKNFKEFTGEDPSKYSFFEKNLANFFLKK